MREIDFDYTLIYSDRRTLSAKITRSGKLEVRAPKNMSESTVRDFLSSKSEWIKKHLAEYEDRPARFDLDSYDKKEIAELKKKTRAMVEEFIALYAPVLRVTPTAVRINTAKGRFGSCSGKNSLNFSCFLSLYPERAVEYVVVHELCHIIEHNHSSRFYSHIKRVMPDYKERVKLLVAGNWKE